MLSVILLTCSNPYTNKIAWNVWMFVKIILFVCLFNQSLKMLVLISGL